MIEQKHLETRDCKAHGSFEATITTHDFGGPIRTSTSCPQCEMEAQSRQKLKESKERQASVDRLRYDSGVPARFSNACFAAYQAPNEPMKLVLNVLSSFATRWDEQRSTGQSLLLVGGPGTGKTMLSCSVINSIAEDLVGSEYSTAAELVSNIKSHYGQRGGDKSISDDIAWLVRVPLLVIDELDVGLSEHDVMLLFRVIDARYAALQPMILISNRNAEQLEQLLGQRIMDRLRECAVTLTFNWRSHRGRHDGH